MIWECLASCMCNALFESYSHINCLMPELNISHVYSYITILVHQRSPYPTALR